MGSRAGSKELIELGERIRKRRQEIHLSQEAFAEKTGISVNTVSRVEGGQTAMSIEVFKKMLEVLDTDANHLLGETPSKDRQFDKLFCRIRNLKKDEQKVVLQTVDTMIDGLQKCR
ncbi:MAG: helix-turn-helix transcriptional regulator [Blautia sp.]|nr:helix-turn-helix domain-containing protein [Blautia sp.]MDY3999508.1 helix-turn-helix transcriptional regulator [Blautia sp.]